VKHRLSDHDELAVAHVAAFAGKERLDRVYLDCGRATASDSFRLASLAIDCQASGWIELDEALVGGTVTIHPPTGANSRLPKLDGIFRGANGHAPFAMLTAFDLNTLRRWTRSALVTQPGNTAARSDQYNRMARLVPSMYRKGLPLVLPDGTTMGSRHGYGDMIAATVQPRWLAEVACLVGTWSDAPWGGVDLWSNRPFGGIFLAPHAEWEPDQPWAAVMPIHSPMVEWTLPNRPKAGAR
jgi:hypothetical protein